jgi:hypothetical protein
MPSYPASSSVWYNLPGIVAAYQPVAAPGFLYARINVAHNMRQPNTYSATPGVAPTWAPATGWTFNGSTQYLTTSLIVPNGTWSLLAEYRNPTGQIGFICGARTDIFSSKRTIAVGNSDNLVGFWQNGGYRSVADSALGGSKAVAGQIAYKDGAFYNTLDAWSGVGTASIYIGALNDDGALVFPFAGSIRAVSLLSRPLSAAEVWQASQQMKYCDANPEWNCWSRKRRYWYAAAAGGFQAAWAVGNNQMLGPGAGVSG